ncbi:MAG: phosphatase PAP2-related protein [Bacteroidota bacterium]
MKKNLMLLFPAPFLTFRNNWKEAWSLTSFRIQLAFTLSILVLLGAFIPPFFRYIQSTPGYIINDVILNLLPVQDFSLSIFLLIYSVILLTAINLSTHPILLLKCIQAYCLLVVIRIFCLYMVPLDPERLMIPLDDPFVGRLFYDGTVITKDLFFSGHVSTMFLFFLAIPFRSLKIFFIVATLLVSVFILIQHVHYTIDVVVAPFVSWISYRLIQKIPCSSNK